MVFLLRESVMVRSDPASAGPPAAYRAFSRVESPGGV